MKESSDQVWMIHLRANDCRFHQKVALSEQPLCLSQAAAAAHEIPPSWHPWNSPHCAGTIRATTGLPLNCSKHFTVYMCQEGLPASSWGSSVGGTELCTILGEALPIGKHHFFLHSTAAWTFSSLQPKWIYFHFTRSESCGVAKLLKTEDLSHLFQQQQRSTEAHSTSGDLLAQLLRFPVGTSNTLQQCSGAECWQHTVINCTLSPVLCAPSECWHECGLIGSFISFWVKMKNFQPPWYMFVAGFFSPSLFSFSLCFSWLF